MIRWLPLVALIAATTPLSAAEISGQYLEARTCDVWTGPCFANAEMNIGGKHAVLAWKIDHGNVDGVSLEGLGVVAVVAASDTLGLDQTGPARSMLIVDQKATREQRNALIRLAKTQGGELVRNVVAVTASPIDMEVCTCDGKGCASLKAGEVKIATRCLDDKHDKVCGNESAFYPPLARGVKAKAAIASEHRFGGKIFNETWSETDRRGAYVGSFEVR